MSRDAAGTSACATRIAITAAPGQPRPAPLLLVGDIADAFRQAAGFGCQGVEIHMRQAEDVDVKLVKRLMADYGLGVPTLGTGMAAGDGLSFTHADAEVRARTVRRVRGHIDFAAEVGSAVTIGSLSGKLGERRDGRSKALESLAEVCVLARRAGVTVLLEPLNRYECDYLNTLADGMRAATEIGAPNLKLLADTFHMNIEEADIAASLKAAGSLVGHVHLADTNRQAPGHGHLDVAAVLKTLDEIGYQGYLSFEVLPLPTPGQAIRDGIDTIHAAIESD
jgi:sugar phosphate isomerase/epimerase